nr:PAS domain S-box protein [Bradyrhizobium jicamae]
MRVNRQLCQLTGYSVGELLGRTVFQETLPEDVSADRTQFDRQLTGEIDCYSVEKRIYRKDGGHFWASVTSSSVRDAGQFLFAVRVQHDITNRKRAEMALAQRMGEQAALFAFSERLQHCTSANQIYAAALDAVTRALDCERASILLLDRAGTMRFVAWRGLSAEYRRAVEGHSPWNRDDVDPHPICVSDVSRADLPDELKQAIVREGIQSAAFIPIMDGGRLSGKFMAYHGAPYSFADTELDVALTLARLLGFSLARLDAETARRVAEKDARQLAAIVESSEDAIVSKDLEGTIQTWNDGAERRFGFKASEVVGRSITLLIPPDRQDEEPRLFWRRSGPVNGSIISRRSASARMGPPSTFR